MLFLDNLTNFNLLKNQFLANAMVDLNMIDTVGSGIRRVYDIQKKKFFPMPDYDLSEDNRVKVILYGKIIDEKYSKPVKFYLKKPI